MYKDRVILTGLFSFLMLFSLIPSIDAELWELIVVANVEKAAIYSSDAVVVTGKVVDHAYKPVVGAEISVRAGSDTTKTTTDSAGLFKVELNSLERIPATYTVNVAATWNEMTGITSIQFQVKGDASPVTVLQKKLSTGEAIRYLTADEKDFEKDPIGQTLFKYYQGLLQELIDENKESMKPAKKQIQLEQQRQIAGELKKKAIEFYNPGYGVYGGYKYDDYIRTLNPEIKDLVTAQMNFTKNTFEEAQKIRDKILADGGTIEKARQAYLDIISIPKEVLEQFNQERLDEKAEEGAGEEVEDGAGEEAEEGAGEEAEEGADSENQ